MSRRSQITMTDAEIEDYLNEPHLCRIGTIGPGDMIHLVTMNYGFLQGAPAFWTYRRAQKTLNLERNPTISMIVDSGRGYSNLKGVSLSGQAEIHTDEASLAEYYASMGERYGEMGGDKGEAAKASLGKRAVVRIVADKTMSWDHTKLGGGY